mmetsp:Transcript_12925/g.17671  ORF Transcript_12925/g.17671 Transcript_12925/m.17671 type:complete len:252 (-) Transcript_12925:59-814(-)|eukprot:CAMPEP_0196582410 /NCGR_PEP_ID=MMETSP1081-20130531/38815_1 /TAXON_ID=36882 /ORGANISM="Pyramimonas amylifera, Strain CCMP720" /LENGTH=251 /DNA_ID=CAMNT_0041902961 /DNA_START=68 /DNA_END=823 /DNA_ORIENTATION=+
MALCLNFPRLSYSNSSLMTSSQAGQLSRSQGGFATSNRSARLTTYAAKKKGGGKKGGGNKKGPSLLIPKEGPPPPEEKEEVTARTDVIMHSLMLLESFRKAAGTPLMEGADISSAPTMLFKAPFCLVSATTNDEPVLNYANQTALDFLGYTWEELTSLSLEKIINDKDKFNEAVKQAEDNTSKYTGDFLTKSGSAVPAEDSNVWCIKSGKGDVVGRAISWSAPVSEQEPEVPENDDTADKKSVSPNEESEK